MKRKTIQVKHLARVEGEGALKLSIRGERVEEVQLSIFEPPRFFEAFLRGRDYLEAPDITSRICGICPVAYQMSSVHALERAVGLSLPEGIRQLRRLLYCGEWIESHTLHIYMLHAPDFCGYAGAVEMAKDHREVVQRGLQLKKVGNEIMKTLAGREIHPINVRVGGFYRLPSAKELASLRAPLNWARDAAEETVRWVASFPMPTFKKDYEFVALRHPDEYPMNEGRVVSNRGLDSEVDSYEDHFGEVHAAHSTALQSYRKGGSHYLLGPMARYHLNFDRLPKEIQDLAHEIGLGARCNNPFQSIIVRSLEVLYACIEALRILDEYVPPAQPYLEPQPQAAIGRAATEAPRGLLYHRYEIERDGTIATAQIMPPTAQNQLAIEDDLYRYVESHVHDPEEQLRQTCEQAIRNYDPCISCATHFLQLQLDRNE